jgi:hypothetical protein
MITLIKKRLKNILGNLNTGQQITSKENPSETNGTFLRTLRSLMTENGGLLKISTTEKTKNLQRITGDYSNKAINIEDLINKVKEPIHSEKIGSIHNFLQKYSNLSLEKKSPETVQTLEFNLDLKYPLEKTSEI